MTREEEIKKIALCYAHDELKDSQSPIEDVVAAAFIDGVNYADQYPHWISVDDELPPRNVFVLTCDGQENENLLMLAGDDRWYDKAVGLHRNITHWMPRPQAPKKGGEE